MVEDRGGYRVRITYDPVHCRENVGLSEEQVVAFGVAKQRMVVKREEKSREEDESNQDETNDDEEEQPEVAQDEQKSQRKGRKRLLPSWMKVGNADPKHFKLDQAEEQPKEKMSAAEFSAAVAKENSEFNASCDQCDFRDPNRKNVMKHRNAEHKHIPFQCKVCGKTFKVAQSLVTHRQNIHMKQLVRQPR